jgi:putative transposase
VPRQPRNSDPGFHHIGVSAAGPAPYFRDEVDHIDWVRRLVRVVDRFGWRCLAFCQMTTHWHALVETPDTSLSRGMHWLNSEYSKAFNERHGRVGYLVRDRFWSFSKPDESSVLEAYRYVVNNPVRAGIVPSADLWRWSSFATTAGLVDAFPFVDASPVLGTFSANRPAAQLALRQFVNR